MNTLKKRQIMSLVAANAVLAASFMAACSVNRSRQEESEPETSEPVVMAVSAQVEDIPEVVPAVYKNSEYIEIVPASCETETPAPYYPLTDADRDLIASVVMAEAGGESYDGQRLVAQCILNACMIDGIAPDEAIEEYGYSKDRPEPSESVCAAVSAVFDQHDIVTDEPIQWFYNPAYGWSSWHESQRFVLECGNHRFFAGN